MRKTKQEINIFEDLIINLKDKKVKESKEKQDVRGWAIKPNGSVAEFSAPTNRKGQWKIISGMPGCGKTSLLIDYYHRLIETFGKGTVAVMAIGERQIEIREEWMKIVPNKDLYNISSDDDISRNQIELLKTIVEKITENNKYKAIIIDSLSGIYNIISKYKYLNQAGLGAGGLNLEAPEFINVYIIRPLRTRFKSKIDKITNCHEITSYCEDRIIISSLLYGQEARDKKNLYESFKALCDSEIVLSQELARNRIFPAIDNKLSYSRRVDKFCSKGYAELVNNLKKYNIVEMKQILSQL